MVSASRHSRRCEQAAGLPRPPRSPQCALPGRRRPDFEQIVAEQKLLLGSLPATTLGDAADLIGSVIVYRLWQAAQRLGPDPARKPFVCLVDEAHRFCRLPQGLAQALAEARGYRLGFCLPTNTSPNSQIPTSPKRSRRTARANSASLYRRTTRIGWPASSHPASTRVTCVTSGPTGSPAGSAQDGRQLPAATAATLPLPDTESGEAAELIHALARGRAIRRELVERMIGDRYGRPDPAEDGVGSPAPDVRPPPVLRPLLHPTEDLSGRSMRMTTTDPGVAETPTRMRMI